MLDAQLVNMVKLNCAAMHNTEYICVIQNICVIKKWMLVAKIIVVPISPTFRYFRHNGLVMCLYCASTFRLGTVDYQKLHETNHDNNQTKSQI